MYSKRLLMLLLELASCSAYLEEHKDYKEGRYRSSTLELLLVVFRHGARTPISFYPNDPYGPQTFYPVAVGDLTDEGKLQMFEFGKGLRKQYSSFLGQIFLDDSLVAVSSDSDRTKKSLQLTLAGMYPPYSQQIWNDDFIWQPIATAYTPLKSDSTFFGTLCPTALALQRAYTQTQEFKDIEMRYANVLRYVSNNTGLPPITNSFIPIELYFNLIAEKTFGLTLPEWTDSVLYSGLQDIYIRGYLTATATDELKKFASGFLLKNIVAVMTTKANGTLPFGRKVYLYSGHDINIAYMLITLGVFDDQPINFSSNISFELHNINGVRYVRVIYQNYDGLGRRVLKLPNCAKLCPLSTFVGQLSRYFPVDASECGGDIPLTKI